MRRLFYNVWKNERLFVAELDVDAAFPVEAEEVRSVGGTHGAGRYQAGMAVHVADVGHAVVTEFHTAGLVALEPFIVAVNENAAFGDALWEDARTRNGGAEFRVEGGGHVVVVGEALPGSCPVGCGGAEEGLVVTDVRGDEWLEITVLFRNCRAVFVIGLWVEADIHAIQRALGEERVVIVVQILFEAEQDLLDVGCAGDGACLFARFRQGGQQHGGQDGDDGDDDEQFDEGEVFSCFHFWIDSFGFKV